MVITERAGPVDNLRRLGGCLSLDFANTVDWRGRSEPIEYLRDYEDLLAWSVLAGTLTPAQSHKLARSTSKAAGRGALARALAFREAAYRVLRALLSDSDPQLGDVATINDTISQARVHAQLRYEDGKFSSTFAGSETDPNYPVWPIALSLVDLLTLHATQLRLCGGPECGWLFVDTSKNRTRRWCSMDGCGNRAKARRHYARTR